MSKILMGCENAKNSQTFDLVLYLPPLAPLVQRIFQFPCPPLGAKVGIFAIAHLLGDPIDTISSLLYKLAVCQSRAELLRKKGISDQDWKALALLMDSYDECGDSQAAIKLESL